MSSVTQEHIIAALAGVSSGPSGRDVVAAGLVSGLVIREGHVVFSIETTPEQAPAMETVRAKAERAVADLPGVLSVTAVLTAHHGEPKPAAPQAGGRPAQKVAGVRDIIAVASGKGGVGKSTTAVNLALALAAKGKRVGVLDADIHGPSIPRLLGLSGKPETTANKKLRPMRAFGLQAMSIGFLIADDQAVIWRGPMVISALNQMLSEVAWDDLDVLVIDLPPGTGDVQLSLSQRASLAGAVIVSTPQDIALIDARRALAMFEKVNVPVLGMIENMSYYLCPHCGERAEIFGHGGAETTARDLKLPFLGAVPLHLAIRETSDAGRPIVATAPESAEAAAYLDIAGRLLTALGTAAPTPMPRISIV